MTQGRNIIFANKHLDVRRRNGVEWLALCPYHDDSNPSFSYNIVKGVFICYSCGAKGNTVALAEHLGAKFKESVGAEDISIEEVKAKVAKFYDDESQKLLGAQKASSSREASILRPEPLFRELWAKRGITSNDVLEMFSLGYDPVADALQIPIHGKNGNLLGIVKRNLSGELPKYVYPSGLRISHHLFGEYQVRCWAMNRQVKSLAIVEGSIDALAMWEVGIPAVALLGAQITLTQSQILKSLDPISVVVMTDMDAAGARAHMTVANYIHHGKMGIVATRAKWDRAEAKDPAELSPERRKEIFFGAISQNASVS